MAVVIETTLGDITVDLYLEQRPVTCLNFLKLCKMKYYNFNLFHTIRSGFIAQTGDPSGEGSGGQSIFGLLEGPEKRFFSGEKMPKIRHTDAGLLSMVCTDDMMVGSQFFFTLGTDLDSLDGVHCVIGEVTEGHEVLRKINEVICDESHRPYQDVRITHTVVLEDPFNDPAGFRAPSRSPSPSAERLKGGRIAPDEEIDETQGKSAAEIQEIIEEKEAKARATILEIVGDLPDADIAPPENVLFVCKLNPVTTDEDLEIIFSRFGKIVSCEVIRDKKTGDSLQYAFIEFSDKKSCEDAYFKMDNVLIDDRRIHVDFSQSVSKMRWLGKGRGVQHFNDDEIKANQMKQKSKRFGSEERRDKNSNRHDDKDKYKTNRDDDRRGGRDRQDRNNERKRDSERDSERRREKSTERRRDKYEKDYEKRKQSENESRNNSHRERSRSRSPHHNRNKREKSRERDHRDSKLNDYKNVDGPTKSDKKENRNRNDYNDRRQRESHSNSHRSKYESPPRSKDHRNNRDDKFEETSSSRRNENEADEKKNSHRGRKNSENMENSKSNSKKRHNEALESTHKTKRLKKDKTNHKHTEPRTPSPVGSKNNSKNASKQKKKLKKEQSKTKRRKDSTSTDSDSSDSSTSSDTSSSSEEDRKRRSKRKRRHSSSSSSDSSDSSSSSSSSDSSSTSDTTSSSSSDERHKKRKKNDKRKAVKKSKKKS